MRTTRLIAGVGALFTGASCSHDRGVAGRPDAGVPGLPRRPRTAWLVAGALLGGTALSLFRHPIDVVVDTVWAEDGTIFLADAVTRPALDAVSTSYAGYYHLVPRAVAWLATAVPPAGAAAVLSIGAALITAALAAGVYVMSAGHLASPAARLLVSAPVVLAPLAQQDVPNSIANLHWPGLYAMFWVLLWAPTGRIGRIVAPLTVALIALSDILVLAFVPLAAVRLAVRRDRQSAWLAAALTAGLAVQFIGLATGSSSRDDIALSPVRWATGYALRAVPAAVLGERWLPDTPVDGRRLALAALAWLLLALAVVVAIRRIHHTGQGISDGRLAVAVAAVVQSVALYALPVILTGVATPRYAFAPALLLLVALTMLLQPVSGVAAAPHVPTPRDVLEAQTVPAGPHRPAAGAHPPAGAGLVAEAGLEAEAGLVAEAGLEADAGIQAEAGILAGARPARGSRVSRRAQGRDALPFAMLAAFCLVVWVLNFRVDTDRERGPRWGDELDRARIACASRTSGTVDVAIPPAAAQWTVTLPCGYVSR